MTAVRREVSEIEAPFLFVPHGEVPPPEWLAVHPDWVKIPATFVPHGAGGDLGSTPARAANGGWPRQRAWGGVPPAHPGGFGPGLDEDPIASYLRISAAMDTPGAAASDPAVPAPPDPGRDAIHPVYPVETLLGIASGGWAGALGAARTAGGALLRQFLPDTPVGPALPEASAAPTMPSPKRTADIVSPNGQMIGAVKKGAGGEVRTVSPSEFQAIEDQLMVGAKAVDKPRYDGTWYIREDGSSFGIRESAQNGRTIDISESSLHPSFKVHRQ